MTPAGVTIVGPRLGLAEAARAVLATLPDWFGIPEANDAYVAHVEATPTWSAVDADGRVVGVLAPQAHRGVASEIELLAVVPELHRHGIGRALVEAFERAAADDGARLLHVKTLGPSHPDAGYAATRRFYESLGYLPLEELRGLWGDTPALVLVKPVPAPRGEAAVVARSARPVTRADVIAALTTGGLRAGGVAIVHSSVSRLGWVVGGARTVVEALREVIGPDGTLVMPAQTGLSDPAGWRDPPVPAAWWPTIRAETPAYDPDLTETRGMGAVVDLLRRLPGTVSSAHPSAAFVANGPVATTVTAGHPLAPAFGDASPLGRLYDLDAQVVLMGVGHANDTILHLAEHRSGMAATATVTKGAPMLVDGVRRWVTYEDLDEDSSDFEAIGDAFAAATGLERQAPLGLGAVRTVPARPLVDHAVAWMRTHRAALRDRMADEA